MFGIELEINEKKASRSFVSTTEFPVKEVIKPTKSKNNIISYIVEHK